MRQLEIGDRVETIRLPVILRAQTGIILGMSHTLYGSDVYIVLWDNPIDRNKASCVSETNLKRLPASPVSH
jgi:hypothetical protein